MRGIYFDEFQEGAEFISPTRTITEADVVNFSAMTGDMNELHTSEAFAKKGVFGRRVVQGLLGLSISHGLLFRLGLLDGTGIAFLGVDQLKFTAPIFLGDTVHAKIKVQEKIPSRSKKDRGIIKLFVQLINEEGTVTQEGIQTVMVRRKIEN